MTTLTQPITAEELLDMSAPEHCELIEGEIVEMPPPKPLHGRLQAELTRQIGNFVMEHDLGMVLTESGFILARDPDTVRAPDVAFIRKDRLPAASLEGYYEGAPDLAVEVISPSDAMSEVHAKINQWLAAGAAGVWLVDPINRQVQIHHPAGRITQFGHQDELTDDAVLPGFVLKLAEIFT